MSGLYSGHIIEGINADVAFSRSRAVSRVLDVPQRCFALRRRTFRTRQASLAAAAMAGKRCVVASLIFTPEKYIVVELDKITFT